ncbi:novN [Symbiodinium natans]|uniref:NovN protein n=1 Tax=Symbiodinium natans TaxID=878477 RepID=A0A812SW51_9DINO|nr:novN [Symbiodinium natans]
MRLTNAIVTFAVSKASSEASSSFCNPEIFPPCDVGVRIGRDAPGLWTTNGTRLAVKASRSSRFLRISGRLPPVSRRHELALPDEVQAAEKAIISIQAGHDASIAIAKGSRIQCVLELERLFEIRYFPEAVNNFQRNWRYALETVRDRCDCEDGPCPTQFDIGIMVGFGLRLKMQFTWLPKVVELVYSVDQWRNVNHHEAHALMAYFSSPFRSAFVLSYDGGGNDGVFNVFLARGQELWRIGRKPLNLGTGYHRLASYLPQVTGASELGTVACAALEEEGDWIDLKYSFGDSLALGFAGKLMGFSGLAAPSKKVGPWIRRFYDRLEHHRNEVPRAMLEKICEGELGEREVAASIQAEFAAIVQEVLVDYLEELERKRVSVEGIVLTGGCALNVVVNQLIRDNLTEAMSEEPNHSKPQDVYVPPAPNDSGLTVGGIWSVLPPTGPRQKLQYLGFRLWDLETLDKAAEVRGARRLSELGGVEFLAHLLVGGHAGHAGHAGDGSTASILGSSSESSDREGEAKNRTRRPIMAVVRGRQEFGPRALGHRSLLAVPDSRDLRDRMNRLKSRQWYRPVAPMIAEEGLEEVFGHKYLSPSMEFAPIVREDVRERFPALAHFDGTARHQSVSKGDEPWVHALLLAVGKLIGLPALINTSFNSRGKPIVNTVAESLQMLDELADLDYVLIEDWLFRAPEKKQIVHADVPRAGVEWFSRR